MRKFAVVSGFAAVLLLSTAALAADPEIDRATANVSAAFQAGYAAAEAAAIAGPGQLSAMKQMQPALQAWSQVANAKVTALEAQIKTAEVDAKTTKTQISMLTGQVSGATARENAANARAAAAQAKAATLWGMLEKKDGEVRRLQNQLAAEQNAAKLKPNPALKAHPNALMNDHGQPLMIGPGTSPTR